GLERGVRPMGLWSISTHLSRCSSPLMALWGAALSVVALLRAVAARGNRVSLIRVDLPEPDTPVMQVDTPMGMSRSTLRRLLPLAPLMVRRFFVSPGRRLAGMAMAFLPDRYWPVIEAGALMMSATLPWAMIWPPWTPAPGPISTTWSAAR